MQDKGPLITFRRMLPSARLPERADRSALGTIPARAAKYCDAITQASAFGYYIFPPCDLCFWWDGTTVYWARNEGDDWIPLTYRATAYPGFLELFNQHAPEDMLGAMPPFLTALPEPGLVQIWTGMFARTRPEWSLLLRGVANFPQGAGFVPYEGIIETDRWFGPLFTNIRLTRTHAPIHIQGDLPMFQAQPLPRALYTDATLNAFEVTRDIADFDECDWSGYRESVVEPNGRPDRALGAYAVEMRRRRRAGLHLVEMPACAV